MSMWKGGHRRSPRISALDAWKAQPPRRVGGDPVAVSRGTTTSSINTTGTRIRKQKSGIIQGPATRTRGRKKRRLKPLEDVAATSASPPIAQQQGGEQQSNQDHPIDNDQPLVHGEGSPKHEDQVTCPVMFESNQPSSEPLPSAPWIPEKRVLELILDILQRRDTYEIFAEPVDPKEVEDYYEIIKEPMDFGTMRAKLHEGMYRSLEQFEHDVFLISGNAMHFNSTATIYFRQARAIHELAKKVFLALKTDPENFELQFSDTRRRSGRRPHSEVRGPLCSSTPKLADVSTKTSSSNFKRSIRVNPGCSSTANDLNARVHEKLSGAGKGRRSSCFIADRRSTYKPWTSFLNENNLIVSTIYNSKDITQVNPQDFNYRESLMSFVKDLGPTAQMIAKRKLQWSTDAPNCQSLSSNGLFEAPKCQNPAASPPAQWRPTTLDTASITPMSQNLLDHPCFNANTSDRMNLFDADEGQKAYNGNRMGIHGASIEKAPNSEGKKIPGASNGEVHTSNAMDVVDVFGSDKVHQSPSNRIHLGSYPFTAAVRDLNFPVAALENKSKSTTAKELDKSKLDDQAWSLGSGLEHSQSNVSGNRLKNNHSSSSFSWLQQTMGISSSSKKKGSMHSLSSERLQGNDQALDAQGRSHGISGSTEARQPPKLSQPSPLASQFIFDIPYLKARLDQINCSGQDRKARQGSSTEGPVLEKKSYQRALTCTHQAELSTQPFDDNHQQRSSLDTQNTDLALQL